MVYSTIILNTNGMDSHNKSLLTSINCSNIILLLFHAFKLNINFIPDAMSRICVYKLLKSKKQIDCVDNGNRRMDCKRPHLFKELGFTWK